MNNFGRGEGVQFMKKKITFNNIIIIILLAIFCGSFIRQEITMKKIEKQVSQKKQELEMLKEENEKLSKQKDTILSDEYIENQARERLGMIKPGEKVIIEGSSNNK
jgi:cell division protein FtsB